MKKGLICLALLAPAAAHANATLQIMQGSGDLQTYPTSITVTTPVAITFRWWTDQKTATAGTWKVMHHKGTTAIITGESAASPTVGDFEVFQIPAKAFLAVTPPSTPATYDIVVQPHDASGHPVGPASSPVVHVKQTAPATSPPFHFTAPTVDYPEIALDQYVETMQQPISTELFSVTAKVKVTATNRGKTKTAAFVLNVHDANGLMQQNSQSADIGKLDPGKSASHTFTMTAIWPPSYDQAKQPGQWYAWRKQYDALCGVDLHATIDWSGPQADFPFNAHVEPYLYQGYGSSKSWQQHAITTERECFNDNSGKKQCVDLNQVARSIYKQLACKVVGYSFFVGTELNGSHGILDSFGEARTSIDPPETAFSPSTKIQIASSSKVLTALAGVRLLGGHLDQLASAVQLAAGKTFNAFPSGWKLSGPAKNISFKQFLSQTSGIRQYYAGDWPQASFDNLQTFFTEPVDKVNAPMTCVNGTQSHSCTDLDTDNVNCGSCGNVCPDGCVNGQCTSSCAAGFTNCAPAGGRRRCVNKQSDAYNCGGCGTVCAVNQVCSGGSCVCPTGFATCGKDCVNLKTDGANCGACGTQCTSNVCSKGKCAASCATGLTMCGGNDCVNLSQDVANCGKCNSACDPGASCVSGKCTCPSGQTSSCFVQATNPIVTYDKTKSWCYSNVNFAIMRLLLPRFAHSGSPSDDGDTLASQYVEVVQSQVFTPVGVSNMSCDPPASLTGYARVYTWPGNFSDDFGPLTSYCGDWGWYVSAEEYAKVLLSLNHADHHILSDCQLFETEHDPNDGQNHGIGWDQVTAGSGDFRYLEKNGFDSTGNADGGGVYPSTSTTVGIWGGHSGCKDKKPATPTPGVVAILFMNSNVANQSLGADNVMAAALASATSTP